MLDGEPVCLLSEAEYWEGGLALAWTCQGVGGYDEQTWMPSTPCIGLDIVSILKWPGLLVDIAVIVTFFRIPNRLWSPDHAGSRILNGHKSFVDPVDQVGAFPDEYAPGTGPLCGIPCGLWRGQSRY